MGVNYTRNEGLKSVAEGSEVVVFLDSDDTLVCNALEVANDIINRETEYFWFIFRSMSECGETMCFISDGVEYVDYYGYLLGKKIGGDFIPFLRKECADNLAFDSDLKGHEELAWTRLSRLYRCRIRSEVLLIYWQDTVSLTRPLKKDIDFYHNQAKGVARYMEEFGDDLFRLDPCRVALIWYVLAYSLARAGECQRSLHATFKGIKLAPLNLRLIRSVIFILICVIKKWVLIRGH